MGRIRVSTIIDASPNDVWDEVRQLDRHVIWMADAHEIDFADDRRSGVGTSFVCHTRVGPIRLKDRMVVTSWRERREIGVSHRGVVTGIGRFTITRLGSERTRFTWAEHLSYPWWLGGAVGGFFGGIVMRRIWRRNLKVLKGLIESGSVRSGSNR